VIRGYWKSVVAGGLCAFLLLIGGCSSSTVKLSSMPPENYQSLGQTTGSACGFLILGDYVLAFIPINLSDRIERAKADALARVPGATDLVNVSTSEFWFYGAVIHGRCIKVKGEAIKS